MRQLVANCFYYVYISLALVAPLAQATLPVDGCDHSSECIAQYRLIIWIIICISTFIYVATCAWCCCIGPRRRMNTMICYLCESRVKNRDWNSGTHRQKCSQRPEHAHFLARLPAPYDCIKCPECHESLKKWPLNTSLPQFRCNDATCIYKDREIRNNGNFRFTCYVDDISLCGHCVKKRLLSRNPESNDRSSSPKKAESLQEAATQEELMSLNKWSRSRSYDCAIEVWKTSPVLFPTQKGRFLLPQIIYFLFTTFKYSFFCVVVTNKVSMDFHFSRLCYPIKQYGGPKPVLLYFNNLPQIEYRATIKHLKMKVITSTHLYPLCLH